MYVENLAECSGNTDNKYNVTVKQAFDQRCERMFKLHMYIVHLMSRDVCFVSLAFTQFTMNEVRLREKISDQTKAEK